MRRTSFLILGLLTVAAVAGAVYVLTARDIVSTPALGPETAFYPELLDEVNAVTRIAVRSAEDSVTVERAGTDESARWQVVERGGYPADPGKVREVVIGTATLQLVETKTANPALFDRLQLRDLDQDGSEALEISLSEADGQTLAHYLRGKTASFGTGGQQDRLFVRRIGENQTWLAEGKLDVTADAASWLDRSMPQVAQNRVKRVVISHADGETVEISRDSATVRDFTYLTMPDGVEAKQFSINNTASALDFVSFEDVRPATEVSFADPVTARYETFDGLTVTVTIARPQDDDQDENWVRFAAAADPAAVPAETAAEGDAETSREAEDQQARDVVAEAAEIEARYGGWAYRVSTYMADRLTRRGTALYEEPEPAAEGKDSTP